MEENRPNGHIPLALYFSIVSSILLILIITFRSYLATDILAGFIIVFFMLIFVFIFLISFILNIVYIIRNLRVENVRAFIPFTISIITILIIQFVPLTIIADAWDFKANLKDREEVVSMIKTGELVSNKRLISLSKEYAYLSRGGGEIIVEREGDTLKVFFFTFRGMLLSGSTGFIYVSDDSQIQSGDFRMFFLKVKRIKENWYWVVSK